jgi:hypothetical protein
MVRSLLTFLFLFITIFAFAQIRQPTRFEVDIENINQSYNIVSAEENGIYIFKEQIDKGTANENAWEVIRLDTALREVSTIELLIEKKYDFKGYSYDNGKFVLLFQEGINYAEDLKFIVFDTKDDSYRIYDYKNVVPIILTEFELKNDAIIFGGNVNYRAVILVYNFTAEKGIVLPGFYTDKSTLLQIVTDTGDEWFRVVTSERRFNRRYGINIRTYSTRGQLVQTQEFDGTEENSLTNGRIVNLKNGENILAGTYSLKKRTELSRGLYLSTIAGEGLPGIRYYNYANLSNFFNYMREKRKERVISRIKRKKIKGKNLKFRYRLEVHDIIRQEDQNILIGEAYYPTYTSSTSSGFGYSDSFSNRGMSQVFDGYKYTHAIIIGFDNSGNLLWDNSFEINDLKSFNLEEHIHVAFLPKKIVMLYLYDQQLKIKIIQEREILEGKFTETLKLKYDDDKVQVSNDDLAGLENWYGNVFFAFGTNKLKNLKDQDIDLNRKVFFINKIVVE